MQLLYVALTSSFPFNSLLAGLACSIGFSVLTCKCLSGAFVCSMPPSDASDRFQSTSGRAN